MLMRKLFGNRGGVTPLQLATVSVGKTVGHVFIDFAAEHGPEFLLESACGYQTRTVSLGSAI